MNKDPIKIEEATLFSSRDNLTDALREAENMILTIKGSDRIIALTGLYVMWNTIAKQYDVYKKEPKKKAYKSVSDPEAIVRPSDD